MATAWQTFPVEFKGGLISNMSPLQHGMAMPGSATFLQNYEPAIDGGYKKVLGYERYINQEVPGEGLILGVFVVSQTRVLVARSDGLETAYYVNEGGAWTKVGSARQVGGKVRGVRFNYNGDEKIFLVDGVNYPVIYNVRLNAFYRPELPDVERTSFVENFKNHIFNAVGRNLSFSAPYADEDYDVANGAGVINVGQTITGLINFREQLIIFTKDTISRLTGNSVSDFQLQPIANLGCPYPDTIQEVGGDVMYMSFDGIRMLGATERIGDFALEVASHPIRSDMRDFMVGGEFNSLVVRSKAQYRVFGYRESTDKLNSKGFVATKFSDQGASRIEWASLSGFKVYRSDSLYVGSEEVCIFSSDDAYVYQMESSNSFEGEVIEAIYESPHLAIDDPNVRKSLYKVALYADLTGIFEVEFTLDFDIYHSDNCNHGIQPSTIIFTSSGSGGAIYGDPLTVFGEAVYGAELDNIYQDMLVGSGHTFSFRIEDKTFNPSYTLDMITFQYRSFDRK